MSSRATALETLTLFSILIHAIFEESIALPNGAGGGRAEGDVRVCVRNPGMRFRREQRHRRSKVNGDILKRDPLAEYLAREQAIFQD